MSHNNQRTIRLEDQNKSDLQISINYNSPHLILDYAPNLSILLSAGKENNSDYTSNGE